MRTFRTWKTRRLISKPTPDIGLLVCLFLLEGAVGTLALVVYRKADRPLAAFVSTRPGLMLLLSLAVVGLLLIVAAARWQRRAWADVRLTLALNVVVLGLSGVTLEGLVRALSVREGHHITFAGTTLLPRSWNEQVAQDRELLRLVPLDQRYFTFDDALGWTVAPVRNSADGLYLSSTEGIRSPRAGLSFSESPAPRSRVALVGDSFTFGLEVKYEDTWGAQLESALGEGVQVLNFGVDAYGVDQAYLRYRRDVRPWRPNVVILGIIDHDFARTMGVYGFLTFAEGAWPFAKPRLVLTEGRLDTLNVPLIHPEAIFARHSIADLPFVTYDPSYHPAEWEWRLYHASYLVRFVLSRFPRWPQRPQHLSSEQADALNGRIVQSFVEQSRAEGSEPLLVYMPSRWPLEHSRDVAAESEVQRILRAERLAYIDTTRCVAAVPPEERFVRVHYSQRANAAVVKCLREPVRRLLDQRGGRAEAGSSGPLRPETRAAAR
jgi:hypothetical protein